MVRPHLVISAGAHSNSFNVKLTSMLVYSSSSQSWELEYQSACSSKGVGVDWLLSLATMAGLMTEAGEEVAGAGDADAKTTQWRERRLKDLEGMAVEALQKRVLSVEEDLFRERGQTKAAQSQLKTLEPDLAELTTYRTYGKPDELKTKLELFPTLETELTGLKREKNVREAHKHISLDGKKVDLDKLEEFVKDKGLELSVAETETINDKKEKVKVKAAYVQRDKTAIPFEEYLKGNHAAYVSWLVVEEQKGVPVVGQSGSSGRVIEDNAGQNLVSSKYGSPKKQAARA